MLAVVRKDETRYQPARQDEARQGRCDVCGKMNGERKSKSTCVCVPDEICMCADVVCVCVCVFILGLFTHIQTTLFEVELPLFCLLLADIYSTGE